MFHHITHDDSNATIEVHPAQELVRLTWKGTVVGEPYRGVLGRLLEAVQQHRIRLWLNDGRRGGTLPMEDQHWTMQEFTPRLMAAGLRRIALVQSDDRSSHSSVDRMINETPSDATYDIAYFEDPAIAQLWLMDPSKTNTRVAWTPRGSVRND